MKVDMTLFEHATWENNWYICPNCGYENIDISFSYCPACSQNLSLGGDERGQSK